MGLYSNNRTMLGDVEFPALEGYNGNVGIATAMLEATQEDLKFFDMIIARDFQEAEMNLSGSVNESEMTYINEGAIANAWTKVKEFLKKLLGKIKAIFSSIMAKINGVIITDNKKLVEKYRKAVQAKNLKDMKYKWAEETGKIPDADAVNLQWLKDCDAISSCTTTKAVDDWVEKNEDDILEKYYGIALGQPSGVEPGDFAKEAHEYMFEDTEDMDDGANSKITEVMSYLLTCKKGLSDLEKTQRAEEKCITKTLKDIENTIKDVSKTVPDKSGNVEEANKLLLAQANATQRLTLKYQTVILAINREIINAVKFQTAQHRAFFTKAAAYNPKAKNENAILFDAIDEAVEFDVESAFADYTLV